VKFNQFKYVTELIKNGKVDFGEIETLSNILKEDPFFKSNIGHNYLLRDELFINVLKSFNKKEPLSIFQVGAIESLEVKFRIGSGWSELFFGSYVNTYGGEIFIADINLNHITNSYFMSSNLEYKTNLFIGDAIDVIKDSYDIYYLDGADEPLGNDQTLQQFKKIKDSKSVVIIDDVPTKGQSLLPYLRKEGINYEEFPNCGSGMIVIDMRDHPTFSEREHASE
jgi:hypothetical protein